MPNMKVGKVWKVFTDFNHSTRGELPAATQTELVKVRACLHDGRQCRIDELSAHR
jgi:hypothetical protein